MRMRYRNLFCAALGLAASVSAAAPTAIEYFHGGFGHYFVTASPQEVATLDGGTPGGWSRTGETFGVLDPGAPGAANVCRFWSGQTFAPKTSHFYTLFAAECAAVRGNRDWVYEGEVFALSPTDAAGACGIGTVPLYRLYNDGQGGAPNHRYTTSLAIRSQMRAQGWIAEGAGIGVIGCAPAPAPFTVVAAADIGQCFNAPAAASGAAKTAALIVAQDALVLTAGDNTYDSGTPAEFANCFDPTWGAFKDRIYPTIGNHETYTVGADGYFGYFGARAGPDRRGYYSFDYGGWHFISLNSVAGFAAQSAQRAWLAADLEQSRESPCTIALLHYPAFNSGAQYGNVTEMRPAFEMLQAAGVEMLLSGHEHVYERFAPQHSDGTADPVRGLRQFVVGTGGHELNAFGAPQPNSEFRYNASWGVLRLTLGAGSYGWQFVPVGGGAPIDVGTGTCHR